MQFPSWRAYTHSSYASLQYFFTMGTTSEFPHCHPTKSQALGQSFQHLPLTAPGPPSSLHPLCPLFYHWCLQRARAQPWPLTSLPAQTRRPWGAVK